MATSTNYRKCFLYYRSLDGRVQFSQRKVLPHLLCVQMWRFPDVQHHYELKAMDSCHYAFNLKKEEICINPYHYNKLETTGESVTWTKVCYYGNGGKQFLSYFLHESENPVRC